MEGSKGLPEWVNLEELPKNGESFWGFWGIWMIPLTTLKELLASEEFREELRKEIYHSQLRTL